MSSSSSIRVIFVNFLAGPIARMRKPSGRSDEGPCVSSQSWWSRTGVVAVVGGRGERWVVRTVCSGGERWVVAVTERWVVTVMVVTVMVVRSWWSRD